MMIDLIADAQNLIGAGMDREAVIRSIVEKWTNVEGEETLKHDLACTLNTALVLRDRLDLALDHGDDLLNNAERERNRQHASRISRQMFGPSASELPPPPPVSFELGPQI